MRILHVITSLRMGGAERLMVDLLPRLRDKGHGVELCVFDGVVTTFFELLEQNGIRIIKLGDGHNVYHPKHILQLVKLMKKYDAVHTHNTAPQLFAAIAHLFIRKPRLITTEHNTTNRRRSKWYLKWGDCWMYRQYEKIICISEQARENLVSYIGDSKKIVTIYNGIDVSRFTDAPSSPQKVDGSKIITMVAAFRPQKDHKTLIKAFDLLPDNFTLQLVGDGETRSDIQCYAKQFRSSDRIMFMGNRSDVPSILKGSDVVVLSSHYEGLSLSSLEGMACGNPFIASDVDGLHEIVEGYGILFPHEDHVALAEYILSISNDASLAKKIGIQCQKRALQFDMTEMAAEYNRLYSIK